MDPVCEQQGYLIEREPEGFRAILKNGAAVPVPTVKLTVIGGTLVMTRDEANDLADMLKGTLFDG